MTILDVTTGALVSFGAATVLRATVLLGGALGLAWLARSSEGAARHALWSVTFGALLALPLLTGVLPGVPVALPGLPGARAPASVEWAGPVPQEHLSEVARSAALVETAAGGSVTSSPASTVVPPAPRRLPPGGGLALLWLCGTVPGLAALALGLRRARRASRAAEPVTNRGWRADLETTARRLGIRRPVSLGFAGSIATPLTGGLLRPVVLLPESARSWSAERRRLVLLHELVHVARADALRQALGRLAMSLYWFHPLVWLASREASFAREEACDQAVLALGYRPSMYARHLLELSDRVSLPLPALSRLEQPNLERRLMAILHPSPARPRRWLAAATAVVAVGWALSVAAVSPRAAAEPPGPTVVGDAPTHEPPSSSDTRQLGARVAETVPARGEGGRAVVADPSPSGGAAPTATQVPTLRQELPGCWLDGFHGDFSGTVSQRTDDRGGRIFERYGFTDGDRVVQTYVDDIHVCMRSHGPVELSDDMARVTSMGPGAWLVLSAEQEGESQRLEVVATDAGLESAWLVNGARRELDGATEEWRDAMLGVMGVRWQISRIRGRVSSLRGEISSVRGRESSLRGEISSIRGRVSSMRGEISSVRGRESSMRGEISSIRGRQSSMRGEISSIRGRQSSMRGEISGLRNRILSLERARRATEDEETRARLFDEIERVREDMAEVERRIAEYDTEARVAEVERRIAEYDTEGRVHDVAERIAEYDTEARVRAIEDEIADYDADARIRDAEERIRELDVDGEVARIEAEIDALDADRRVAELEAGSAPAERRLRDAIRAVRRPS